MKVKSKTYKIGKVWKRNMKNPKAIGNENERRICRIINEILGSEFKRTEKSGGGDRKGDIYEYQNSTPLRKYDIEVKYHGSWRAFNKDFKKDLLQARIQAKINKNWLLIEHIPDTSIDIAIIDLQDYLINDVISQMTGNREDLKKELLEIEDLIYRLRKKFENLRGKL